MTKSLNKWTAQKHLRAVISEWYHRVIGFQYPHGNFETYRPGVKRASYTKEGISITRKELESKDWFEYSLRIHPFGDPSINLRISDLASFNPVKGLEISPKWENTLDVLIACSNNKPLIRKTSLFLRHKSVLAKYPQLTMKWLSMDQSSWDGLVLFLAASDLLET